MEPESKRAKFNSVGKIPILDETTGQIVFNDHEDDEADDNDAIVGGADDDENGSSLASLCAKSQEILNAVKHDAFDAHIDFIQMASAQSLTDHNHNNIDLNGQKKPLITSSPSSSNEAVKKSMASSRLILFDSNSNLLDETATTAVTATTKTIGKKPSILPASLVFGSTSSNSSSNISPHVSQAYSILAQEITSPMTLSPFSSLLQPPAVFTSAVSSSNSTSSSSSIQRCSHLTTNLSQQEGNTIG